MKTIFNDLCIGVFAAIWALTQTLIHLWWILMGRFTYACPIKFDAHETKFHKPGDSCNDALSAMFRNLIISDTDHDLYINTTAEVKFANTRLTLPSFSETTTDILMLVYIILDGMWIVTSVSLLLASSCKFKEKSALYFYLPWVVIGTVMATFDLYCTVYFGLNIPENWTLLEWLENLGIIDQRLPNLIGRSRQTSTENNGIGFRAPVFLMALFTSRFFFIWFVNVFVVFAIFGIAKKVSGEKEVQQRSRHNRQHRRGSRESSSSTSQSNFHSTFEERVRNWQLYYGTLRENVGVKPKKKRTSITYLETSANGTELRCIDLSSYDSFKKGRVRIASDIESSTDNETMNSTFKYGEQDDSIMAAASTSGTGRTGGGGGGGGRRVSIVEAEATSSEAEATSRF